MPSVRASWFGRVVGKRGAGVRRIATESGAIVRVLRVRGPCILAGSATARRRAAELIQEAAGGRGRIRRSRRRDPGSGMYEKDGTGAVLDSEARVMEKEARTHHLVRQARLRLLDRAHAGGQRARLLPGGRSAELVRGKRGGSAGSWRERGGKAPGGKAAGVCTAELLLEALELGDSATVDGGDGLLHAEEEEEE